MEGRVLVVEVHMVLFQCLLMVEVLVVPVVVLVEVVPVVVVKERDLVIFVVSLFLSSRPVVMECQVH